MASNKDVQLSIKAKDETTAALASVKASLDEQQAKLKELGDQYRSLNSDLKASEQAQTSAGAQVEKLSASIERQEGAVQRAAAKHQDLSAKLEASANPSARLTTATDQASAALDRQSAKLGDLKTKLALAQAAQASAGAAATEQRTAVDAASVALNSQKDKVGLLRNEFGTLKQSLGEQKQALTEHAAATKVSSNVVSEFKDHLVGLAASIVGLSAGIEGIKQVSEAFVTLESARVRLTATLGGNEELGAAKFDMLRRLADRLGISYGILTDEYSKMVGAARGSILAPDIDDMFVKLQEIYRVNKLTGDQIKNANHDIAEMISQGQIYHRVIVQQLGSVLPGAVQMFAKSLQMSTGEFERLMKAGSITSETLKGFIDTMWESGKDTLPKALDTYTASLGKLSNAFFQAKVSIAENGVAPALKTAVDSLDALLGSANGDQMLKDVGQALGGLIKLLAQVPKYFDEITAVAAGFISLKLAGWVVEAGAAFRGFALTLVSAIAPARAAAASMGVAQAAAVGLRAALTAAWSSTGLGLIIGGIAAAVVYLRGGVDDSTEALHRNREIVDQVKDAYDRAADKTKAFTEIVSGVSKTQVEQNLNAQNRALKEQINLLASSATNLVGNASFLGSLSSGQAGAFKSLIEQFKTGRISLDDFKTGLDGIAQASDDPRVKKLAGDIQNMVDGLKPQITAAKEAAAAQDLMTGAAGKAAAAQQTLGLGLVNAKAGIDAAAASAKNYADALHEIGKEVPGLKASLEAQEQIAKIVQLYNKAVAAASGDQDKIQSAYLQSVEAIAALSQKSVLENFSSNLNQGALAGVKDDLKKAVAALLARIVAETDKEFDVTQGLTPFAEKFAPGKGSKTPLPMTSAEELASKGDSLGVAGIGAFLAQSKQWQDELTKLGLVAKGDVLALAGEQAKADADAEHRAEDYAAKKQKRYDDEREQLEFTISQGGLDARQQAINNALKQAGLDITRDQTSEIAKLAGKAYDVQQGLKQEKLDRKEIAETEKALNDFYQGREAILKGINAYRDLGDFSSLQKAEMLKGKLSELDSQFLKFLDQVEARAEQLGNPKLIAMIAEFRAKVADNNAELFKAKQINNDFADGAVTAFKTVGESIGGLVTGAQKIGDVFKNAGLAFRKFAADFLEKIGDMIAKQAILNALGGANSANSLGGWIAGGMNSLFSGSGSSSGSWLTSVMHSGGVVGAPGGATRLAQPSWFANAARIHSGGFPGLSPDEVPAILQKGEQVLSKSDVRNGLGGGGAAPVVNLRVNNSIDPGEFFSAGAASRVGELSIMNAIKTNRQAVKSYLGLK